jgi:hypothetical protein
MLPSSREIAIRRNTDRGAGERSQMRTMSRCPDGDRNTSNLSFPKTVPLAAVRAHQPILRPAMFPAGGLLGVPLHPLFPSCSCGVRQISSAGERSSVDELPTGRGHVDRRHKKRTANRTDVAAIPRDCDPAEHRSGIGGTIQNAEEIAPVLK